MREFDITLTIRIKEADLPTAYAEAETLALMLEAGGAAIMEPVVVPVKHTVDDAIHETDRAYGGRMGVTGN